MNSRTTQYGIRIKSGFSYPNAEFGCDSRPPTEGCSRWYVRVYDDPNVYAYCATHEWLDHALTPLEALNVGHFEEFRTKVLHTADDGLADLDPNGVISVRDLPEDVIGKTVLWAYLNGGHPYDAAMSLIDKAWEGQDG